MRKAFSHLLRSWSLEIVVIAIGVVLILGMSPMMNYMVIKDNQGDLRRFQANGIIYAFNPTGRGDEHYLVIHDSIVFGLPEEPDEVGGSITACGFGLGPDVLKKGRRFKKDADTNICIVDGERYTFYKPIRLRDIFLDIVRLRI